MIKQEVNIWSLLRKRFPEGTYALLREVRNNAGFSATNSADAIAVNLWPSRGLEIEGIELKSFRSDWLNERKNPKKAEAIFKYCDRFWLVTSNDKVVLGTDEIPATWGWICACGSKLITKVQAPKLQSEPLSKGFVAAMLKRATHGLIHPSDIEERIKEAVEHRAINQDLINKRMEEQVEKLQQRIKDFEQASGVRIDYWQAATIGEAVKFVLNGGAEKIKKDVEAVQKTVIAIHDNINNVLNSI